MAEAGLPLLDEDHDERSVLEPAEVIGETRLPERVVLCFFGDVVRDVVPAVPGAHQVATLRSEAGESPVWQLDVADRQVAVFQPGVGAPLAAAFCEEAIAMGARRIIACGGAGALRAELPVGHALVLESAVRDEGTSYHYLPAATVIEADPHPVRVLTETARELDVAHEVGRSWTTDAVYRETAGRVARRVEQGCSMVEMEAAALFAVARYRGVQFGQVLMAGDTLVGDSWDDRGWMSASAARARLFWLAARAAAAL